jgi:hypothetical protein
VSSTGGSSSFAFDVYVRNESPRDSSVVSTVEERRNVREW